MQTHSISFFLFGHSTENSSESSLKEKITLNYVHFHRENGIFDKLTKTLSACTKHCLVLCARICMFFSIVISLLQKRERELSKQIHVHFSCIQSAFKQFSNNDNDEPAKAKKKRHSLLKTKQPSEKEMNGKPETFMYTFFEI